jgi:hypothetical protein
LAERQLAKEKKQMSFGKIAVAAATFASVTLLSFGWSDQHGASLSVASAQAQEQQQEQAQARERRAEPSKEMTSKEMTSKEMTSRRARMSPRHERRIARRDYGERGRAHPYYSPNPVQAGADVAAGAVNAAGAVAAGAVNTAGAIVGAATSPYDAYASGPYAGMDNGYYASSTWGDYECQSGSPGCKPYSAKGWK